mmetsp:Transcript_15558/g.33798  ORF Transcript_15558/g.33798 Transcript_15558/m.33798 type:complete len:240 (-) Transcript_15558:53-772(-)|eukprot:CAMPEP_0206581668 /NCGR_PEP_ID=MMETSP0325_2-20121206/33986_1 /ASSEMBLY_ACC=CAM_ASM_000347 /TAXON_ID=2866 /ORGANISM="Crypthecodinium cohnii, Strain Seligo" /LENGTH=239 /DNA_ID=CAMNT_0054088123 /DNA_START=78 /DNA_END=797 /DNA_ORIENTATION=+
MAESDQVQAARASKAIPEEELRQALSNKEDYDYVLQACANNVKMGPWHATSGLVLEYYLNAATNMLDKHVATPIARMVLDVVCHKFKPEGDGKLLLVGMEMAGGVMVGQATAVAPITHPHMLEWCDFVYCRKDRKKTGTVQQLEGPQFIVDRKPDSPAQPAIFLDDALSSGGSMRDAVKLLKDDYNIDVVGAIYLVDRSKDRTSLAAEKMGMADDCLRDVQVTALYDLAQVDAKVPRKS